VSEAATPQILVSEIFSAIQGEAALVGERQIFVRLTGCNFRCAYCDQPEALERAPGPCRIERIPGRRDWLTVDSPLPIASVVDAVDSLWQALPHHSISLTGGEPLMQQARVGDLARGLSRGGRNIMLETNGTLVGALTRTLPWLSHVSMDIKLTSVDGERVDPTTQARFLDTALAAGTTTWVKIVLGASTDGTEFDRAVDMVAAVADRRCGRSGSLGEVDRRPEIFLQPVTPFAAVATAPSPEQVLDLQERALRRYPRVRVVPQTHKAIGQL
jgi:7-carboxy-7-deazaguanine synthase